MMYQLRDNNRLIVIDGRNSYHITEYADKEKLIHSTSIRRAWRRTLLMRVRTDSTGRYYSTNVRRSFGIRRRPVSPGGCQFGSNEIHQKVEILNIKVLQADSRKSFVRIEGQLIRSFVQNGERGTYAVKFEAAMSLATNYDLAKNAIYPFVVTEMTYHQDEIKQ